MRTTTGAAVTTIAVASTIGLSACGSAGLEPKVAFGKAYGQTVSQQDLATKVSVKTTSAEIEKLITASQQGSTSPSERSAMRTIAKVLPKITVTSKVHSNGANLGEETDRSKLDEASTIAIDGKGLELVRVGSEAFVKVDADGIGQATGAFTGDQLRMLSDQVPAQMSWVGDLVDGKWIGLPTSTVEDMLKGQDGGLVNDPAKMKELRAKVQTSLEKNATFEDAGEADGAKKVTVKVKVKPFFTDLQQIAASASATSTASATPSPASSMNMNDVKDDAVMTIATTVKDDRVRTAELALPQVFEWIDPAKLDADAAKQLAAMKSSGFTGSVLVETATEGVSVTKPAGARMLTQKDIDSLEQLTSGAMGGASSTLSPAA